MTVADMGRSPSYSVQRIPTQLALFFFSFLRTLTYVAAAFAGVRTSLRPEIHLTCAFTTEKVHSTLRVRVYLRSAFLFQFSLSFLCMFCLISAPCRVTHRCVSTSNRSQCQGKRLEKVGSLYTRKLNGCPDLLSLEMITPTPQSTFGFR